MTVIDGPWSRVAPRQSGAAPTLRAWYERLDRKLRVFDGTRWFSTPVPEAKISAGYPQPNRAPDTDRITQALDARGMDGPEVDEALGVAEPTVDLWESGAVTPTPADVRRLATLTGFPVHFFYRGPVPKVEHGWICGKGGCRPLGRDVAETCPHCGGSGEAK